MGVFVLIYIILSAVMYLYTNSLMVKDLIEFAAQYGIIQNTLLKELAVPYAILLEDGKIIWLNSQFEELIGDRAKGDTYISKIMPELNRSIYPRQENDVVHMDVFFEEREYPGRTQESFCKRIQREGTGSGTAGGKRIFYRCLFTGCDESE